MKFQTTMHTVELIAHSPGGFSECRVDGRSALLKVKDGKPVAFCHLPESVRIHRIDPGQITGVTDVITGKTTYVENLPWTTLTGQACPTNRE